MIFLKSSKENEINKMLFRIVTKLTTSISSESILDPCYITFRLLSDFN